MEGLSTRTQERIKNRVAMKKASHDARKIIKGFCSNPYCSFCKKKGEGE